MLFSFSRLAKTPRMKKNPSGFHKLVVSFTVLSLLFSAIPSPILAASPAGPAPATSPRPWVLTGPEISSGEKIAQRLKETAKKLGLTQETGVLQFTHVSEENESPALLEAVRILTEEGWKVAGTLVTPEKMAEHIAQEMKNAAPVFAAFQTTFDTDTFAKKISRAFQKAGSLTFWNEFFVSHLQKWAEKDWKAQSWKGVANRLAFSLISASVGSGWFLWAASGREEGFTRALGSAATQLTTQSPGLIPLASAGSQAVRAFGELSPTTAAAAGALFVWIIGYQTFFTAINSFRMQAAQPYFDPTLPAGQQLVTDRDKTFSRLFFFASSMGLESFIAVAMTAIFNGGHMDMALAMGALWNAACASAGYMPAETLAGTYNERSRVASALAEKRIQDNAGAVDETTVALQNGARANGWLEYLVRNVWWNGVYGPMKNSQLLGMGGFVGNTLSRGFEIFFAAGVVTDVRKNWGRVRRTFDRFVNSAMDRVPGPANCSDYIAIKAIESVTVLDNSAPSDVPNPAPPQS